MEILFGLALSTHLGLTQEYNEIHPHIRLQQDGAIAGAYYNSVERLSVYAGYRIEFGDAGVEFAAVTGYPAYGTVAPFVRGTYDFGDNVRAFVSPAVESYDNNNSDIGVVIGTEFRF